MKKLIVLSILFIYVLLLQSCSNTRSPEPQILLLQNVNIVDTLNARIIPAQQILVENGVITATDSMENNLPSIPDTVIDGKNGYVTPGLIDMHVHIYDKNALPLALSHGVVHQRIMNGMPQLLDWREEANKGEVWGSTLSVSSPILTGRPDDPLRAFAASPQQGAELVNEFYEAGYDLIKVYNSLSAEVLDSVIIQGKELGMPVALHGPHPPQGMHYSQLQGLQSIEHVEDIFQGPLNYQQDQQKLDEAIANIKRLNVPVSATLAIFQQLTRISAEKQTFLDTVPTQYISPVMRYYEKQDQVKRWLESDKERADFNVEELDYLIEITRQLHEQDVELVLGSDSGVLLMPMGLGTHNELQLLARAGLNNYEALRTATINAAKALDKSAELGQIKSGFRGDFIYTLENPIEDIDALRYPDAIVRAGHWYGQQALQSLRQQALDGRSVLAELWLIISNY